jgi:hypothetical protein
MRCRAYRHVLGAGAVGTGRRAKVAGRGGGQRRARETRTGLWRESNQSLSSPRIPAGKKFGEGRDCAGDFGHASRFRPTETALSRASGGKAAESQRLFRPRWETGIAQDCVVELAGLEPANKQLYICDGWLKLELLEQSFPLFGRRTRIVAARLCPPANGRTALFPPSTSGLL